MLERYLGEYTQNPNENFNASVCRLSQKHLHAGIKIVEIAAYIAAGMFKEIYSAVLIIMNTLEIKVCQQCKLYADASQVEKSVGTVGTGPRVGAVLA